MNATIKEKATIALQNKCLMNKKKKPLYCRIYSDVSINKCFFQILTVFVLKTTTSTKHKIISWILLEPTNIHQKAF